MKFLHDMGKSDRIILCVTVFCVFLACCASTVSALVTEFVPGIYISEDYTDNYDQTEFNKIDEFYTTYGMDLSLGFFQKTAKLALSYNPEFRDYEKHNEEDALEHSASLIGEFQPSARSLINLNLNYDGHASSSGIQSSQNGDSVVDEGHVNNNRGESWQHSALIGGSYELSKYTGSMFSADYTNSYDRQLRTGDWNESKNYTLSGGINHQFGRNDSASFDYTYSMTDYVGPDSDDFETHTPSVFLSYWFNPQFGFDSNLSYEYTTYDLSKDNAETWSGDFRFIRTLTKHFQVYTKYEHTYTKEEDGDHTVYNPSIGFDWSPTEDSGASLGLGYMIQKWEDSEGSESVFVDADIFKTFNFSKQGAFTIAGASGYEPNSNEAASLGFRIYYQAGFMLSYQLLKDFSTQMTGSYIRDQFDDPDVNRVDDTFEAQAGLTWAPWKRMKIDVDYTFTDFSSDDELMENYQENRGTIMLTLYPTGPPRMLPTSTGIRKNNGQHSSSGVKGSLDEGMNSPSVGGDRADIESKIFNTDKIIDR